jgi:rod shape-determining protein MreB and related proteins
VPRFDRGGSKSTRRGADRAVAIDAGASAIRLWTPAGGDTETSTLLAQGQTPQDRSDATAAILEASRDLVRQELSDGHRRRGRGFPAAVAIPARAGIIGRRRAEAAAATMNRRGPVVLMEAPLAAAAGANIDVGGTAPRVVLDVGVHGSEVAVLADGRVIEVRGCAVGCHDIERAVLAHVFRRHRVLAAPQAAWRALRSGSMTAFDGQEVRTEIRVNRAELVADLWVPVSAIVEAVRRVAERGSARLGTDALAGGVTVVGGGGCLPPLINTLQAELAAPVTAAADPRRAVIRGLAKFLRETGRHPELWNSP